VPPDAKALSLKLNQALKRAEGGQISALSAFSALDFHSADRLQPSAAVKANDYPPTT
jgi:hypothetical protein